MEEDKNIKLMGLSQEEIDRLVVSASEIKTALEKWNKGFMDSINSVAAGLDLAFPIDLFQGICDVGNQVYRIHKQANKENRKARNRALAKGKRGVKRPNGRRNF